jgi:hypothetical protein
MRFVILHYHFLKNAGTSLENILHRSFGGYFTTIDTADRDGHVSNDELLALLHGNPLLKAVSSHQLRYPKPQVPGFLFFDVCFLRDRTNCQSERCMREQRVRGIAAAQCPRREAAQSGAGGGGPAISSKSKSS